MDRLPKECFVALAAIGWADGNLDPEEARELLRAARAYGVEEADVRALAARFASPVELGDIDRHALSPWERLLTYALATWLTRVDGVVTADEQRMLDRLGVALDLPFAIRCRAEAATRAAAEGDVLPSRFDFASLARVLRERLPHLAALRT